MSYSNIIRTLVLTKPFPANGLKLDKPKKPSYSNSGRTRKLPFGGKTSISLSNQKYCGRDIIFVRHISSAILFFSPLQTQKKAIVKWRKTNGVIYLYHIGQLPTIQNK